MVIPSEKSFRNQSITYCGISFLFPHKNLESHKHKNLSLLNVYIYSLCLAFYKSIKDDASNHMKYNRQILLKVLFYHTFDNHYKRSNHICKVDYKFDVIVHSVSQVMDTLLGVFMLQCCVINIIAQHNIEYM